MVACAWEADLIWHRLPSPDATAVFPAAGDPAFQYLTSAYWTPLAQLRADDLIICKGVNSYYGWILRCIAPVWPFAVGDFLVAVRGTMDDLEWVNDALAGIPFPCRVGGSVGLGFWKIYDTMQAVTPDGQSHKARAFPVGNAPYVTGHSLGAALATYLAMELQGPSVDVRPYLFASPRTGTPDFVAAYKRLMPTYSLVNYEADLVPQLPPDLLFSALLPGGPTQNVHIIPRGTPGAILPATVPTNHSAKGYAAMLSNSI